MYSCRLICCWLLAPALLLSCKTQNLPQRSFVATGPTILRFSVDTPAAKFGLRFNFSDLEMQAGFPVGKGLAISANTCLGFLGYSTAETGVVFYRKIGKKCYMELNAGYGFGLVESNFDGGFEGLHIGLPANSHDRYEISTMYHKLYFQPSLIIANSPRFTLACTAKCSPVFYSRYDYQYTPEEGVPYSALWQLNENAFQFNDRLFLFFEPALTISKKSKKKAYSFLFQVGAAFLLDPEYNTTAASTYYGSFTKTYTHPDVKMFYAKLGLDFYLKKR